MRDGICARESPNKVIQKQRNSARTSHPLPISQAEGSKETFIKAAIRLPDDNSQEFVGMYVIVKRLQQWGLATAFAFGDA